MKYVGVSDMIELIGEIGVEKMIAELATYVEQDYARWDEFDKSPRYAYHDEGGVIELMPTGEGTRFGFKYVNGHPGNYKKGLQTVVAFGVLSDVDSGYPILLSEMTFGTALRTAATSAIAAKYMARKDSRTMGMIGAGCQAEFQSYGFRAICGVDTLRIYDIDSTVSEKMARNMADAGFNITICKTAEEAVEGADIITTCTADKQYATILSDNMVGQGIHINAIGGDCPGKTELHPDILKRGNVIVEFEPQSRIEGEIQHMPEDFKVTELHHLVKGDATARATDLDVTIFDSVGFAVQDFSFLRYVNDKIDEKGGIKTLDIIAELDDPRDLYGLFLRQEAEKGADKVA